MFAKKYSYLGPAEDLEMAAKEKTGVRIRHAQDVLDWIASEQPLQSSTGELMATYVVTARRELRLADRHAEHVVCAGGEKVLAAGEIGFVLDRGRLSVSEVTNQSTDYCPEPACWKYVKKSLKKAGIENPGAFTVAYIFRRCEKCDTLNLVKDEWYVCAVCDQDLSKTWNCAPARRKE